MKTTNDIFKEVLIDLGFADHKPSELSNSDYWMATEKAMELYADKFKVKADKWDKLDSDIGKYYEQYNKDHGDISDNELIKIAELTSCYFEYL